jgi:hypothetical protein
MEICSDVLPSARLNLPTSRVSFADTVTFFCVRLLKPVIWIDTEKVPGDRLRNRKTPEPSVVVVLTLPVS